jgi:6-phosphogluconolactonase
MNTDKGTLVPHAVPALALEPGSGPRHMIFSPDGQSLFVVNELASSLTAFQYNSAAGTFQERQSVSLLPADFQGKNTSADVHITPSGKFLYASNRGHDSLAIFSIDQATGKLTLVGHQSTLGKTPRNFAIDPSGAFLLAANQDSGTIVTFRIDPATGTLSPTGQVTELAMPVCIKFFE